MNIFRRLFLHSGKHYAIAAGIGLLVALASLLRSGFTLRIFYLDALTAAGAVLILLGLLFLTLRLGSLDVFSYGLSVWRAEKRYKSLYDYREAKAAQRRGTAWTFMPYIAVGLILLAAGALLGIGL